MNKPVENVTRPANGLTLQPGYALLGPAFYSPVTPTPLPDPYWVGSHQALASEVGINPAWMTSDAALQAFTGNQPLSDQTPIATVYSGHQFGVWAGQLGDGRALLLGETQSGLEIQLKGAGLTPYSRMGDGRAVLRSSIREFLASEAMHGLGIPTTRALCVTGSDAPVYRETTETSAVVTRLAPSFIRFGHFEHFASREQVTELKALADHVIDRHYPLCRSATRFNGNAYANLLECVSERTAAMVAQWQAVGFCHGVMNTDNMSILGLTIDYGPFQFLDAFDPDHICNHSDTSGRYAFNKQPNVAYWNLFALGQALLPLIEDQALALDALASYKTVFPEALMSRMRAKMGVTDRQDDDRALIDTVLKLLAQDRVDYTIFWRRLSHACATGENTEVRDLFLDRESADRWLVSWRQRLQSQNAQEAADLMLRTNPKFVLRNHLGELAIRDAKLKDFSGVHRLLHLLTSPFDEHPGHETQAGFPPDWAQSIEISCSS